MKAMVGSSPAGARVPSPPGTMRTSSGGAVVNVCVGTMDWAKVDELVDGVWAGILVETGSSVAAIMERLRGSS